MTNYSLILARNFRIFQRSFVISHVKLQNWQGNPSVRLSVKMATKDALENLNTQENMKKDFNRYFAENVWKILNFISQIKV